MKKKAISVTEAARNFAECVNRVHYQNVQYVLLRNGTPLASLVPERVCTGRDLADALEAFDLSAAEGRSWAKDLRAARKKLKVGYDYVHSLVDDHSRLAYSEILPDEQGPTCADFL